MTIQEIGLAIYELNLDVTVAEKLAEEIASCYSNQRRYGEAVDMQLFLLALSENFRKAPGGLQLTTDFIQTSDKKHSITTIQELSLSIYEMSLSKIMAVKLAKEIETLYSTHRKYGKVAEMQLFLITLSEKFSKAADTEFVLKPQRNVALRIHRQAIQEGGEIKEELKKLMRGNEDN